MQVGVINEEYQRIGLGLSIVQKILELHQSKIIVNSKVGAGTTYTFAFGFENANEDFEKKSQLNMLRPILWTNIL